MDSLTRERRSWLMSRIRSEDTKPELTIRHALHREGLRFRLHVKNLPGRPDLVFASRRKVIFVHGCFWHGHACKRNKMPKSRVAFWREKIATNRTRDAAVRRRLRKLGWRVLTIWECEAKDLERTLRKLENYLNEPFTQDDLGTRTSCCRSANRHRKSTKPARVGSAPRGLS
ncbi:MAG: DNA mismatch endonuclease Vsr [Gammaproteobacteria bacterium]|nr:DNA mismatch endonuclease Vsr [Gammaproteobacteria bacterium]